jgi:hypothetical protein
MYPGRDLLDPAIATVHLTAQYLKADGVPARGQVWITPWGWWTSDHQTLPDQPIVLSPDGQGRIEIDLPATEKHRLMLMVALP